MITKEQAEQLLSLSQKIRGSSYACGSSEQSGQNMLNRPFHVVQSMANSRKSMEEDSKNFSDLIKSLTVEEDAVKKLLKRVTRARNVAASVYADKNEQVVDMDTILNNALIAFDKAIKPHQPKNILVSKD